MTRIHLAWLAREQRRWLRPDAHRWLRPDAAQFQKRQYPERKYSSDQPRVPAGNPDGGQWTQIGADGDKPLIITDDDPWNDLKPGSRYAQADSLGGYEIDIRETAHILAEHVRNEGYVLSRVRREVLATIQRGDDFEGISVGSFSSLGAAAKLVNSTLSQNRLIVDQVAGGLLARGAFESRFDSPTGYEAYVRARYSQPVLRDTYGVRVVMQRDPAVSRGYRLITAFPVR